MSVRTDRLGNIFSEEISEILNEDIKDNNISFVTITYVKVTTDLSFAKIYFTTLKDRNTTLSALNKASKYIRGLLAEKVSIRKMPELIFVYDDSVEYGQKIENIIERINDDEGSNSDNIKS